MLGRYYLQAEQQMSSAWSMMKIGCKLISNVLDIKTIAAGGGAPTQDDWLIQHLSATNQERKVGIDPALIPGSSFHDMHGKLKKKNISLVSQFISEATLSCMKSQIPVEKNLVDEVIHFNLLSYLEYLVRSMNVGMEYRRPS